MLWSYCVCKANHTKRLVVPQSDLQLLFTYRQGSSAISKALRRILFEICDRFLEIQPAFGAANNYSKQKPLRLTQNVSGGSGARCIEKSERRDGDCDRTRAGRIGKCARNTHISRLCYVHMCLWIAVRAFYANGDCACPIFHNM